MMPLAGNVINGRRASDVTNGQSRMSRMSRNCLRYPKGYRRTVATATTCDVSSVMSRYELPAIHRQREGPRTVRVIRYGDSGSLVLSVGLPGRRSRGQASLTAEMARELAAELNTVADSIEANSYRKTAP
jgi:hypothetical protein